jgi:hypothetical protein
MSFCSDINPSVMWKCRFLHRRIKRIRYLFGWRTHLVVGTYDKRLKSEATSIGLEMLVVVYSIDCTGATVDGGL